MRGIKIVLDLEFTAVKLPPPAAAQEVIEIGAVAMNDKYDVVDTFQMYVKPQHTTVSKKVKRLTGITDEILKDAVDFSTAVQAFFEWLQFGQPCRFYTWSKSDQHILISEAAWKGVTLPPMFHKHWVDLQSLHQRIYHFSRPLCLVDALGSMLVGFEGTEHGALADARNTGEILKKLSDLRGIQQEQARSRITYNGGGGGFTLGLMLKK